MDHRDLFKHIFKYSWLLLIVPALAVVLTHYKVKNLPKQYMSQALLSTGFVDQSKQVAGIPDLDFFKTGQQFTNIIEKVKLKKVVDMLSYSLIIHDLENPRNAFEPFSKKIDSMTTEEKEDALVQFRARLSKRDPIDLNTPQSVELYHIISSMYYDEDDINKSLIVAHAEGSDFISVTFTSGNPELAKFVVNTLCTQFVAINDKDVDQNQGSSMAALDSIVKVKEHVMNEKADSLSKFKNAAGVLNLEKQSESTSAQLLAAGDRRSLVLQKILADKAAITDLQTKLNGNDPYLNNSALGNDNIEIVNLREQIHAAINKQVDDNYAPADEKRIDSLERILYSKINRNNETNIVDPVAQRTTLLAQRQTLITELDQAQGGLPAIDKEISDLRNQYQKMVPFDANIQNYQRDYDQALKDYQGALTQYNLTRTQQSIGAKVNIAQYGVMGAPEPSKTKVYMILAGLGSFTICLALIIAIFFLDRSVKMPLQLTKATDIPVIGSLNLINADDHTIKYIWNDASTTANVAFKNALRSLRFDISNQMRMNDSKILGITSLTPGEGRSFVASCLAYAFAMTGRKVLLIGAEGQSIENEGRPELQDKFENFLVKREIHIEQLITSLSKNDSNTSLFEIQSANNIRTGFEILRRDFDIIIIDVNSLRDLNVAKEWLMFTEKNLAVFRAGKELTDRDMELLKHLKNQPGFMGWVMNKVKLKKAVA